MNFNLSDLQNAVNDKFEQPLNTPVKFYLTDDCYILSKFGEVAYFFNYEKLQEVLDVNGFTHYYQEKTAELINELLSKHIINQITAARGYKLYPEIKTVMSDLNKWN